MVDEKPPDPPVEQQVDSKPGDKGTDQQAGQAQPPATALDPLPPAPSGESEAERKQREREERRHRRETRLRVVEVIFAGAVALFAFVQARVSYWQWDIMSKTLEASERAWIVVKEAHTVKLEADKASVAEVVLANVGQTPAKDFTAISGSRVMPKGARFEPVYGKLDTPPSHGVLGPGHPQPVRVPLGAYTPEIVASIKAGQLVLYTYGRVTYADLIKPDRWATFCNEWEPDTGDWNVCETYNESP